MRRLKPEHKNELAPHLSLQLLRTLELRVRLQQTWLALCEELQRRGIQPPAGESEHPALDHAMVLFRPEMMRQMTRTLRRHIWLVGDNQTDHPLYTSDAPVVRHSHLQGVHLPSWGIASRGIEVAFPLTPRYVLMIVERVVFADKASEEFSLLPLEPAHVDFYNWMQVMQSHQRVFCPDDRFDLARRILDVQPEAGDPGRQRVVAW
jgi:hypothetical protein